MTLDEVRAVFWLGVDFAVAVWLLHITVRAVGKKERADRMSRR